MRRRDVIAGASILVAAPRVAEAQAPVPRIGLLSIGTDPDPARPNPVWVAFLEGMDALGWREGRNVAVERRFAGGDPQLLPQFVADLGRLRLEAVVVTAELEAKAVKDALPAMPVVMLLVPDPVAAGLVTSLARPGGNLTGLSTLAPETYAKRLQVLKEALPGVTRVAVLFNPVPAYAAAAMRHTADAAGGMEIELRPFPVSVPEALDAALGSIADAKVSALIVVTDGVTFIQRAHIARWATAAQLPTMFENRNFVDAGGLIAYGPSYADLARRGATYVDRILAGAKPADLPIEQPTKFELLVNLKTATALGLTMPLSLLARADEVIE
jgi:putative tryptophan/tyrosine transport system substrate-binding protein